MVVSLRAHSPSPQSQARSTVDFLHSTTLELTDHVCEYLPLDCDMLGSDPGTLNTLSLRGVSLLGVHGVTSPPKIPALANLRTLDYVGMNRNLEELELRFILTTLPRSREPRTWISVFSTSARW